MALNWGQRDDKCVWKFNSKGRDRLQRKGVQCTDLCPHCETTFEKEWHLFIGCDSAKKVWMEAVLWTMIQTHAENATGFEDLCFSLLAAAQEPHRSDIVVFTEAEAHALKAAILWLGELGLSKVQIELDCLLVVQAINNRSSDQTEFGVIIDECKLLLVNYPNFKMFY
jgi:hypothetical protein